MWVFLFVCLFLAKAYLKPLLAKLIGRSMHYDTSVIDTSVINR